MVMLTATFTYIVRGWCKSSAKIVILA